MNCNNYFDMTDQGDSFETWQGLRGPAGPQGPAGAPGAPGTSVELRGPVETTGDLPATASSSELWLVGSAAPYHGWFYNGEAWEDAGEIAVGPTGPQGPAGADGTDGSNGVTFTPTISSAGVISWTNDGSLPNPDPVDIKGPQGETGQTGPAGQDGTDGSNGVTFTPAVSSAGVISWTNDGGLPNPESVNIKGPQGETGQTGPAGQDGTDGSNGATFTPSVSSAGVISWTNDGGLPNPQSVNIKGPQGETGATGPAGPGVPSGGSTGQVLTKTGAADYATAWQDPSGGGTNPNLLDNWYFVGGGSQLGYGTFPVNQRGQTTYSGFGYTIDRWRSGIGLVLQNNYATFKGSDWVISPFKAPILGSIVTASILLADGSLYNGSALVQSGETVCYDGTDFKMSVEIDSSKTQFVVHPYTNDINVVAVKLELGSTQTLAHLEGSTWVLNEIPNFSEELAKCQLYLCPVLVGTVRYKPTQVTSSLLDFSLPLTAPMAKEQYTIVGATPTIYFNSSAQTGFTIDVQYPGLGIYVPAVVLRCTKNAHGGTFESAFIGAASGTTFISAE